MQKFTVDDFDDKQYEELLKFMESSGRKGFKFQCEKCGADGMCYQRSEILPDGYVKMKCQCGGRMKALV